MSDDKSRGFAAMDRQRQRDIASLGGQAAHAKGTAHEFSRREARRAGRKGGLAVSRDRDWMARIGRSGGFVRSARARALTHVGAAGGSAAAPKPGPGAGAVPGCERGVRLGD